MFIQYMGIQFLHRTLKVDRITVEFERKVMLGIALYHAVPSSYKESIALLL